MDDGALVGSTSSVAFGHSTGKILAFDILRPDAAVPGTALEVAIMGLPRPAQVVEEPAYDPQDLLLRTYAARASSAA